MSGYDNLLAQFNRAADWKRQQNSAKVASITELFKQLGETGVKAITDIHDKQAWDEFMPKDQAPGVGMDSPPADPSGLVTLGGTPGVTAPAGGPAASPLPPDHPDAPAPDEPSGAMPPAPGAVPPPGNPAMMSMADPQFAPPASPPPPGGALPPPPPPDYMTNHPAPPAPPTAPAGRSQRFNWKAVGGMSPGMQHAALGVAGAQSREDAVSAHESLLGLREQALAAKAAQPRKWEPQTRDEAVQFYGDTHPQKPQGWKPSTMDEAKAAAGWAHPAPPVKPVSTREQPVPDSYAEELERLYHARPGTLHGLTPAQIAATPHPGAQPKTLDQIRTEAQAAAEGRRAGAPPIVKQPAPMRPGQMTDQVRHRAIFVRQRIHEIDDELKLGDEVARKLGGDPNALRKERAGLVDEYGRIAPPVSGAPAGASPGANGASKTSTGVVTDGALTAEDYALVPESMREEFKGKTPEEQRAIVEQLRAAAAGGR